MLSRKPEVPDDLRGVDSELRRLRPELPEDRMRSIGARARGRARASIAQSNHLKEPSLRSRLAIISMLVLGFGFSGAGVGLAVTGVGSQNSSAADQQYERPTETETPTLSPTPQQPQPTAPVDEVEDDVNEVEDQVDEGAAPVPAGGEGDDVAAEESAQEVRQLATEEGGQLPFTGFAAIPVLLTGLALLSAGFLLRRRTGDSL